jgi:hypothetical protein
MNNGEALMYSPGRTLTPVMDLALAQARLKTFQEFIGTYMIEGEDFGLIPGTNKKSLWKPGSDKLCELYGLSDSYRVIDRLVDFDRGLFDYEIECTLSRDGMVIATGLGSCSSFEGKYRWRDSKRVCPTCGKDTIAKSKDEYGGGWYCNAKYGGCGAKFPKGDESIEGQEIGRIENDDIATLKNTILKMAKKRAKVDATLSATRSSGVFTQDYGDDEGKKKPAPIQQPQRRSVAPPKQEQRDVYIPLQEQFSNEPQDFGEPPPQDYDQEPQGIPIPAVISEAQRKRLYAIARGAGYSDNDFKAEIERKGYVSSKDVTKADYEEICKHFENKKS